MTATEELRALLDAKGAEWWPLGSDMTECVVDDMRIKYRQVGRGLIVSTCTEGTVTPAQAVEATLGRGTCQVETTENWLPAERYHRCKECGAFFAVLDASHDIPPRYCPNCGRKVVTDG